VSWTVYQAFGDARILEEQYPSMKAWVEYMRRQAGERYIWSNGFSFGDWLAFATTESDYPGATTDKDLIQTAYFARSTELLAKTAQVLGKTEDAADYTALENKIAGAFQKEFVTPNGRLASNTQTAYALALAFGLLPESERAEAAARLAADVRKFGHLTTGFLGAAALPDAERLRISGRGVHAAQPQRVPLVAVSRDERRNDDLGAMGWDQTGR